jgi:phospholipid/cholesterol/gamma-HCH transport system substrate-binding protein
LKKDITNKIRLGIFISLGLALFTAGIYFIGATQQMFSSTFRVSGVFKDVSGLQAGNIVRFSGINVGTVESITIISDSSVRVDMRINDNVREFIKKDAEAIIGTEGLLGNKILIITPGTRGASVIENNDVLATSVPTSIDDIMRQLKTTSDNAAHITGDLSEIVGTIRSGKGTIGKLLMDSTYLKVPIDNATHITEDLSEIVGTLRSGKGTLGKLLMDSTYLQVPIDNAIHITNDLKEIVESLRSGKGVAGRILMDSTAAVSLDTTLLNLKEATFQMNYLLHQAKSSFLLWGF